MDCPKCNMVMEKVTYKNIQVDRCTHCQGIWFDLHEHEKLAALKDSESIDIGDPKNARSYNKIDKINCPICKIAMIKMVDYQQPHIWYESCPGCHGVFFDAGEFTDYKNVTIMDMVRDLLSKERK